MNIDLQELVLRVPGLSPADARRLGELVARRVADRLADGLPVRADLGGLNLRLTLPRTTAPDALVDPIADAILARLR